jgi:hypothetical protein
VDALTLQASGRVRLHGGDYTVSLDHCAAIQGRGLSLSEIVLKDPHLELCASPAGPLYRAGPNGWSLHAGWQTLAASLPHWMLEARAGAGRIDLARAGQSLTGHVRLSAVDVRDQHAQPRFTPARLRGALSLSKRGWSGDLALSAAAQASLASVHLTAAPDLRSGRAQLAANAQFTSGGLQPSSLSPLLTALRRASGRVQLTALANWSNGQLGGAGQVQLQDFAFASPLGDVSGVNTLIALTSLWPLESAPNQLVQIGRVDALLPVTQLAAHFTLGSSDLQVEDAGMHFAGGTLTVGATRVPLRRQPTIAATVHLNDIDLNQLVAASTLSDRVTVDLHVSGTLPLTYGPTGLTVHEGSIFATGPGRLAIARSVWNAAPAGSAAAPATVAQTNTAKANVAQANVAQPQVAQAKPNAIQDFAYQALEHLAVDALDGRINSLPDGRLGILLHSRGRNDPASSAPTRIGIFELLRGRAFDKPVPLPSGTPIDATLDSSLNLEGLTGLTGNQREAH